MRPRGRCRARRPLDIDSFMHLNAKGKQIPPLQHKWHSMSVPQVAISQWSIRSKIELHHRRRNPPFDFGIVIQVQNFRRFRQMIQEQGP